MTIKCHIGQQWSTWCNQKVYFPLLSFQSFKLWYITMTTILTWWSRLWLVSFTAAFTWNINGSTLPQQLHNLPFSAWACIQTLDKLAQKYCFLVTPFRRVKLPVLTTFYYPDSRLAYPSKSTIIREGYSSWVGEMYKRGAGLTCSQLLGVRYVYNNTCLFYPIGGSTNYSDLTASSNFSLLIWCNLCDQNWRTTETVGYKVTDQPHYSASRPLRKKVALTRWNLRIPTRRICMAKPLLLLQLPTAPPSNHFSLVICTLPSYQPTVFRNFLLTVCRKKEVKKSIQQIQGQQRAAHVMSGSYLSQHAMKEHLRPWRP